VLQLVAGMVLLASASAAAGWAAWFIAWCTACGVYRFSLHSARCTSVEGSELKPGQGVAMAAPELL
jgi:hypothetical protein